MRLVHISCTFAARFWVTIAGLISNKDKTFHKIKNQYNYG